MYHGEIVPGFPQHPHRGFETVTIVRRGLIDHSDSLGATARFGRGDVQWLTAGRGIVHSEMFPLLDSAEPNPVELFQIWLNLPARDKMVEPHFTMLWEPNDPARIEAPGVLEVRVVAGKLGDATPPVAAAELVGRARRGRRRDLDDQARRRARRWTLPPARPGTNRDAVLLPRRARRSPARRSKRRPASRSTPDAAIAIAGARPRPSSCCCRAGRSASRSRSTARS